MPFFLYLLQSLVVKPDQLIKRRGKLGLVGLNKTLREVQLWLKANENKEIRVDAALGKLRNFIVEPFVPHADKEEYYLCIYATRSGNTVLFHTEGGMSVGDIDSKAYRLDIDIDSTLSIDRALTLVESAPSDMRQ